MKIIKNIFIILILLSALGYSVFVWYDFSKNPCASPLKYRIGRVDSNFGVTAEQFGSYVTEAELVWEKAAARNLFIIDNKSDFTVNLIYDERQYTTIQKQKIESGLLAAEEVLSRLDGDFGAMKASYEAMVLSHNEATSLLEERQRAYESKVKYWNDRGGAPKKEYAELQSEAVALNNEAKNLNNEATVLNLKSVELNSLLKRRNEAARKYNIVAEEYNKKYGQGLEFNQAEYTDGEINIYQFINQEDLVTAIAHEFCHALGIGHVETPGSLMYYLTSGGKNSPTYLSENDLIELKRVCKIE